jgi:hypothetical protein
VSVPHNPRAFPCVHDGDVIEPGMSLRDYFAAQALVGLLSSMRSYTHDAEMVAWAYKLADGMLAVRNGGAQ